MQRPVLGESVEGLDIRAVRDGVERGHTRPLDLAVDEYRARSALRDAAAEPGAVLAQPVP